MDVVTTNRPFCDLDLIENAIAAWGSSLLRTES